MSGERERGVSGEGPGVCGDLREAGLQRSGPSRGWGSQVPVSDARFTLPAMSLSDLMLDVSAVDSAAIFQLSISCHPLIH